MLLVLLSWFRANMYMWIQIFPELDSPLSSAQTLEVTVIISFNQIFYFHNSSA